MVIITSMLKRISSCPISPIIIFFLLLFLADGFLIFHFVRHQIELSPQVESRAILLLLAYNAFPGLAALVAIIITKRSRLSLWRLTSCHWAYFVFAFFLFPLLAFAAASVSVFFNLADWDLTMIDFFHNYYRRFGDHPAAMAWRELIRENWQVWLVIGIMAPLYALIPSLFESIGWQAFFYQSMPKKGFWLSSISTGLAWWIWYLPVIILGYPYPYHPWLGTIVGLGFGLTHQIILNWLHQSTRHLGLVVIARASLSGLALLPLMLTTNYERLWTHLHGLVGIAIMALFIVLLRMFNLTPSLRDTSH